MAKKVGLALGGGAILGVAHVGVLKALEEKDIPIHSISGTSIGAMVGAMYAFGKSCDDILNIAKDLDWINITSLSLSRYGLLSNDKMGDLIKSEIGNFNIQDANIPLHIVATDIKSGQKVVLSEGNLADAVLASTCIPGIFKPVSINKKSLVDGGIVENVPINTLVERDMDEIIAVDLNAHHSYDDPSHILDIILNSFHFMLKASAKLQCENANKLIQPDLSEFDRSSFDNIEKMVEIGYDTAIRIIEA